MSGEWTPELMEKVYHMLKVDNKLRSLRSDTENIHERNLYSAFLNINLYNLFSLLINDETNTFRFPIPEGIDEISERIALYMNTLKAIYHTKLFAASNMHLLSQKLDNILMMIDQK